MKTLQVLGTGCPKCNQLAAAAEAAASGLGLDYKLEKVTDLKRIIELGVMTTPVLVVDGEVKCVGRVPRVDEIKKLLR
jgi:small redox-active disulfide protein 2